MTAIEHARPTAQEFPILTSSEARSLGLTKHFTGRPCIRGHVAERWVGGGCVECGKIIRENNAHRASAVRAAWYQRNVDSERARNAKRLADNPEKVREIKRRSREKHKEANRVRAKERRDANPEKYREQCRVWRKNNLELAKLLDKQRRDNNIEQERARCRSWHAQNPEKSKAIRNAWIAENPEKRRASNVRRKARLRNASGTFSASDIGRIMSDQNEKCAYCKTSIKHSYHVDHIQPVSKGGSNWPKNLQLLCPNCNHRKHAKDPIDWAREIGRLV